MVRSTGTMLESLHITVEDLLNARTAAAHWTYSVVAPRRRCGV